MEILAFAASLRKRSLNRKLIQLAAELALEAGAEVDLADFREFEMPLYDADQNEELGLPPGALELRKRIERVDAIMIASPEYNYSISGALKNAVDWVSRARPMPWRCKSIYLMSASPSPMGGVRGLWQTRIPLEGCGALVFPDMFALPQAMTAFDEDGRLRDVAALERLKREVTGFVRLAEAVSAAWHCDSDARLVKRQKEIAAAIEDESEIQPPAT